MIEGIEGWPKCDEPQKSELLRVAEEWIDNTGTDHKAATDVAAALGGMHLKYSKQPVIMADCTVLERAILNSLSTSYTIGHTPPKEVDAGEEGMHLHRQSNARRDSLKQAIENPRGTTHFQEVVSLDNKKPPRNQGHSLN